MDSLEVKSLAHAAASDVDAAVRGWLKGVPKYEIALLSRMTERLGRRRRGCKVGYRRFKVLPSCFVLHGMGESNRDQYGADLAVTLEIPGDGYLKTALFQLKRFSGSKVELKRAQREAVVRLASTEARSFVLAIDQDSGEAFVASSKELLEVIPDDVQSPGVDIAEPAWFTLEVWLYAWIECSVGAKSDPDHPDVEYVLERFFGLRSEQSEDEYASVRDVLNEFWADWHMVRAWLRLKLMSDETSSPV